MVYNPPNNALFEPLKRNLDELCSKYADVVILGDFNVNLLKNTSSVARFKDILDHSSLKCPSNVPTNFVIGKNPSQIDLILVNNLIRLKRFSQISIGSFTSHDLIYGSYALSMSGSVIPSVKMFRNIDAINPSALLKSAAKMNFNSIYLSPDINEQVAILTNCLVSLLNKFAPLKPVRRTSFESKPVWFTVRLQRLINVRNYFHHAALTVKYPSTRFELTKKYKSMRNKVTTLKRNLKSLNFSKSLDPALPPKILWRNLKSCGVTKSAHNVAEDFSADEFNNFFSSGFAQALDTQAL